MKSFASHEYRRYLVGSTNQPLRSAFLILIVVREGKKYVTHGCVSNAHQTGGDSIHFDTDMRSLLLFALANTTLANRPSEVDQNEPTKLLFLRNLRIGPISL
jgi:hypothetical protein